MFILPLAVACAAASGGQTAAPPSSRPNPAAGKAVAQAPKAAPSAARAASDAPRSLPGRQNAPSEKAGDKQAQLQPTAADKETFTVQFQDTDIAQALQMLSIQGQKNIITGKNVSGTVTANLFEVTVQEALDVILKANDLRYEEVGNFIYVYTREEWDQMQQARRKRESRRFPLEYINAKDANEFVAPLLSEAGKVASLGAVEKGVAPDTTNAGEDSWAFQAMLIVNDYPENLQAIADLLADVDTPPTQVSIESTIVSTRVSESDAFGVDFSIIGDLSFTDFTNPLSAINNLITGNNTPGDKATDEKGFQPADNRGGGVSSTVGQTQGPGGLKVGVISENASVFVRVLDEVTDTVVLARPRVLALNRQRAQILVGEKVGYLSTTTTETSATQTVQYLDTGIKLIFRPFISKDNSIRMELAPSVSEAVLRQVTDRLGGGIVIPDEKTNQITTNVRVKDGQTLVLGGLFQEKTTTGRRQVPGLGDVPLFGAAFRGQDDTVERNEIIFLITPNIVKEALASAMGKEAQAFAEAVRVGAREGVLFFSREALSANQNQDAMEALAKGDTELALYHTENSLRINHNQPEMILLRSELDKSRPALTFERDMMKRIMQKQIDAAGATGAASAAKPPVQEDPLAKPASGTVSPTTTSAAPTASEDPAAEPAPTMEAETAAADELSSMFEANASTESAAADEPVASSAPTSEPASEPAVEPTPAPAPTLAPPVTSEPIEAANTSEMASQPSEVAVASEPEPTFSPKPSFVVGAVEMPGSGLGWLFNDPVYFPWLRFLYGTPGVDSSIATVPDHEDGCDD